MWEYIGVALVTICILIFVVLKKKSNELKTVKPTVVIMLGSGGHTTEMCELVREFKFCDCSKVYVITGTSDKLSKQFFLNYLTQAHKNIQTQNIDKLGPPIKNKLHHNNVKSIPSHFLCASHFISNGPGIAIPYFYIFWFLNKITITKTKLIFIESWCRVKSLSLTGKLAKYVVCEYIVNWPEQQKMGSNMKYYGQVI